MAKLLFNGESSHELTRGYALHTSTRAHAHTPFSKDVTRASVCKCQIVLFPVVVFFSAGSEVNTVYERVQDTVMSTTAAFKRKKETHNN